jgi:hypothetical protein
MLLGGDFVSENPIGENPIEYPGTQYELPSPAFADALITCELRTEPPSAYLLTIRSILLQFCYGISRRQ